MINTIARVFVILLLIFGHSQAMADELKFAHPEMRENVSIKDFVGLWTEVPKQCNASKSVYKISKRGLRTVDVSCDFTKVLTAESGKSVLVNATCVTDDGPVHVRWSWGLLKDDTAIFWIHDFGNQMFPCDTNDK